MKRLQTNSTRGKEIHRRHDAALLMGHARQGKPHLHPCQGTDQREVIEIT